MRPLIVSIMVERNATRFSSNADGSGEVAITYRRKLKRCGLVALMTTKLRSRPHRRAIWRTFATSPGLAVVMRPPQPQFI